MVFSYQAYHALQQPEVYELLPGTSAYRQVIKELYEEATLLATIRHDRILSFQGICLDDATNQPKYVLTELAAKGSLRQYLNKLRRLLSPDELFGFTMDIMEGLNYLHGLKPKAIVHRDLKPENVLVFDVRPDVVVLKIGDVGLARFIASTSRGVQSQAGSLYYMSPEVLLSKPYDGRADVFSLGITICEVVVTFMLPTPMSYGAMLNDRDSVVSTAMIYLRSLRNAKASTLAAVLVGCTKQEAPLRLTSAEGLAALKASG